MAGESTPTKGIEMSKSNTRKSIPEKTRTKLWMKAGGRCQYDGCNDSLWRDAVTMIEMNKSYIAHIVADSPNGPRGDKILSPKLATEFSNLMLLCDSHHRLIDTDDVEGHPADLLTHMKEIHERRIEAQTGVHFDKKTEILLYGANIGAQSAPVSYPKAVLAVSPRRYPTSSTGISLGMKNSSFRDDDDTYWTVEKENLRKLYEQRVAPAISDGTIKHLSVFGIAPQPLLVLLGTLLSDLNEAEIFQLHREPAGWSWPQMKGKADFIVEEPTTFDKAPALVLALSADISDQRISEALGNGPHATWKITTATPHNDFMKSPEQLSEFRMLMRRLLNKIKLKHGENQLIHVFPAAPVSACIELGRVRMPKADLPFRLYNQMRQGEKTGFFPTFDIGI